MREWLALKSIVYILGVFAAAMLGLWWLTAAGYTQLITPSPEGTAEQFVRALKAHRFEAARHELSDDLARQAGEDDLRRLTLAIERARGSIEGAHGKQAQQGEDAATAVVEVRLGNGKREDLELALRKEDGLWKITSFEALRRLAS